NLNEFLDGDLVLGHERIKITECLTNQLTCPFNKGERTWPRGIHQELPVEQKLSTLFVIYFRINIQRIHRTPPLFFRFDHFSYVPIPSYRAIVCLSSNRRPSTTSG